jgi:glycosyltransferase involved in cell wall biosynthesis
MRGGVETHNYSLVKYLLSKGHDVEVIVLWPKNITKEEIMASKDGVNKGITMHDIFPREPLLWILQLRRKIDQLEKSRRFDVIDIHTMSHILPFIFDKKSRIILSQHFFQFICPKHGWPLPCMFDYKKCSSQCKVSIFRYLYWKFIRNINIKRVKKIMVKYDYLKNAINATGIPSDKVAVVPHWTDTEQIEKLSKSKIAVPGINKNDKVFLFFGRLVDVKGPDILLEAFNMLAKEHSSAKLVFIGDGNLREKLVSRAKELDISDRVLFLGRINSQEELYRHFSVADFIVFPHRYFNYEWALIEGMASGKPIIATDVAATRDILSDRKNAFLCSPDAGSLCSAMKFTLSNPVISEMVAANALAAVKQKHNTKNLELYEQLIREVAGHQ